MLIIGFFFFLKYFNDIIKVNFEVSFFFFDNILEIVFFFKY